MRDCIDDRLKHRCQVELRHISPPLPLVFEGRGLHVSGNEPTGFLNLTVEWTRDVGRVELIPAGRIRLDLVAAIGNGLDVGIGEPTARISRGHQHTSNRRSERTIVIRTRNAQLAEQYFAVIV